MKKKLLLLTLLLFSTFSVTACGNSGSNAPKEQESVKESQKSETTNTPEEEESSKESQEPETANAQEEEPTQYQSDGENEEPPQTQSNDESEAWENFDDSNLPNSDNFYEVFADVLEYIGLKPRDIKLLGMSNEQDIAGLNTNILFEYNKMQYIYKCSCTSTLSNWTGYSIISTDRKKTYYIIPEREDYEDIYDINTDKLYKKATKDYKDIDFTKEFEEEADKISKDFEDALSELEDIYSAEYDENITTGQKNALDTAKYYLKIVSFSKSGLIRQLEYEGFDKKDAKYAANNCGADWNQQAKGKAISYLESLYFSEKSLLKQLEYEGFTKKQALYGVKHCGADWMKQAKGKAKEYMELMSLSRDRLESQLEYEGFRTDEIKFALKSVGYR